LKKSVFLISLLWLFHFSCKNEDSTQKVIQDLNWANREGIIDLKPSNYFSMITGTSTKIQINDSLSTLISVVKYVFNDKKSNKYFVFKDESNRFILIHFKSDLQDSVYLHPLFEKFKRLNYHTLIFSAPSMQIFKRLTILN